MPVFQKRFTACQAFLFSIPYEEREMLIEQLWSVVLDDDYRTPEENKFMRVLTHLFGISDVNSAKARSRVIAKK